MSLISGLYYCGNPKQKPKQWGPFSTVRSVLRDRLEHLGISYEDVAIAIPVWESTGGIARSYGPSPYDLPVNHWYGQSIFHGASETITGPAIQIILKPFWSIFLDVKYRGVTSVDSAQLIEVGGVSGGDYFRMGSFYGAIRTMHYNNYAGIGLYVAGFSNDQFSYVYTVRSNTDHRVFIDGVNAASDTTTSIGQGDSWRTDFKFTSDSDNDWLINQIIVFYISLSDTQIADLTDRPWQLWQPPTFRTYFDLSTDPPAEGWPKQRTLTGPFWGPFGGI